MAIEPVGGLSLSLVSVRNLVACCPSWQAWTGVDQLAEELRFAAALQRVHLYAFPPPATPPLGYELSELESIRPAAVITTKPPSVVARSLEIYVRTRNATSSFVEMYTNYIYLQADVPNAYRDNPSDAYIDFTNRIGSLVDDMVELEGADLPEPVPYVQSVAMVTDVARIASDHNQTQGDFMETFLRITSGLKR